ncbi:hypothetical protein [Aeromonas hydrophila]|uniref:hypothetical protein n=1 Tax=Aeromonas hydrophila TaxID=644 RepID=UPI003D22D681
MTEKEKRRAAVLELVGEGVITIPSAIDKGLGIQLGLDSAGLRYVFKELVKDGHLVSKTVTKKVRTPPHVGRNGLRDCKVVEFRRAERVA